MSEIRGDNFPGSRDAVSAASLNSRQQGPDEIERIRDDRLEAAILDHAEQINEGNNGLIYRLDLDAVPEELRRDLKNIGIEGERETAVKILKVYSRGSGKREFEMQQRAFAIASQKEGNPRYAQVPKPLCCRDLPLTPDAQTKLKAQNPGFLATDRVEVLAMDLVKGEDVATQMFREVLKDHPKTLYSPDQIDRLSFERLAAEVQLCLGFTVQTGTTRDESARIHDEMVRSNQNKARVLDHLEKNGAQIDPKVAEQMENTLDLFRKEGLVMRDAHHRNFMVAGDMFVRPGRGTAGPRVFIVDFANAVQGEPGLSETEMTEKYIRTAETIEGQNYHDPKVPLRDIRPLTVPLEVRRARAADAPAAQLTKDLDSLQRRIEERLARTPNPELAKFEGDLEKILEAGSPEDKDVRLALAKNPFKSFDSALVSIRRILQRRPELKDQVRTFCEGLRRSVPVNEWNRAVNFLKTIK